MAATVERRNRNRDLTTGRLTTQILRLSFFSGGEVGLFGLLPLILAYWAGKVGSDALAGVALGTSLYVVLTSACRGTSLAGMALISQYVGSDDRGGAEHVFTQTLLLLTFLILGLTVLGISTGRSLLTLMGATGALLDASYAYLRAVMLGLLVMEALPCLDNIVRGAGFPEYTLLANLATVLVMFACVPALVIGWGPIPGMGAAGAGWGMVIGSLAGTTVLMVVLLYGRIGVKPRIRFAAPDLLLLRQITRIAFPATGQRLSFNMANALFMTLVTSLGDVVLVAYTVVNRVTGFLLSPVTGIGMATSTLVGQNVGAGHYERIAEAIRKSSLAAATVTIVLMGVVNLWPRPILGLFTADTEAIRLGIIAARFMLAIGAVSALNRVFSGALMGAGDTLSPMIVNVVSEYVVQLPIAWLLVKAVPVGPLAVWIALVVGQSAAALALFMIVRKGRWEKGAVVSLVRISSVGGVPTCGDAKAGTRND